MWVYFLDNKAAVEDFCAHLSKIIVAYYRLIGEEIPDGLLENCNRATFSANCLNGPDEHGNCSIRPEYVQYRLIQFFFGVFYSFNQEGCNQVTRKQAQRYLENLIHIEDLLANFFVVMLFQSPRSTSYPRFEEVTVLSGFLDY